MVFQSTHSVTECDENKKYSDQLAHDHFNPRTPLQSAITHRPLKQRLVEISIHALRYRVRYDDLVTYILDWTEFQSTHSVTECDRGSKAKS